MTRWCPSCGRPIYGGPGAVEGGGRWCDCETFAPVGGAVALTAPPATLPGLFELGDLS